MPRQNNAVIQVAFLYYHIVDPMISSLWYGVDVPDVMENRL